MAVAVAILQLAGAATVAFTIYAVLWFWTNPKVRVMHGLEHATLKLLERRFATTGSGAADSAGFAIKLVGIELEPTMVAEVARRAIARVAGGETELAYDRLCGTVQRVAIALPPIVAGVVATLGDLIGLPAPATFAVAIGFAAPTPLARFRLGMLAQRAITVSTVFRAATVLDTHRDGDKVRVDIRALRPHRLYGTS